MANFTFLNFCTIYDSKGDINKPKTQEPCFGKIFHIQEKHLNNSYNITVYKVGDKLLKEKLNNACFFTRKEITRHLRIVKGILRKYKFHYRIKEEETCWIIKVSLDAPLLYHKYLLTWVRYLYEFPFNMFLVEALKLKVLPKFKDESTINLFNLVGATIGITGRGTYIHAIGPTYKFKKLMKEKDIINRIEELKEKHGILDLIFEVLDDDHFKTVREQDELKDSKTWESEEKFQKRLKLYKKNYLILKQRKL